MKLYKAILLVACSILLSWGGTAQDRFDELRNILSSHAAVQPGLNDQVELSVGEADVREFIRGIGSVHGLNLSVSPKVDGRVVNNFTNATVSDVLLYLCKEYNLDLEVIGSILSIKRYVRPPQPIATPPRRQPGVTYNDRTDFLSLDLQGDSLPTVARAITSKSLKNVVLGPGVHDRKINVFIQNRPFLNALEKMAFANGLKVTKTEDNFYLIETLSPPETLAKNGSPRSKSGSRKKGNNNSGDLQVTVTGDRVQVIASNVPASEVIEAVSAEMGVSYFLYNKPDQTIDLYVENVSYEGFLDYLLSNTDYTYKKEDRLYLIGTRNLESLRITEMVRLENRTVESVAEFIPADLKKDVDIKEFIELNGLILSGSRPNIEQIKAFIRSIDQVVPVVMIEVIIADVSKNASITAGMSAGFNQPESPTQTSGLIGGTGVDVSLNSQSVNDILNTLSGFGLVNLGNVTPSFYFNIQALESNGVIKTRSTPKLATINGHEASLTVGTTEFYEIRTLNTIGSVTASVSEAINYQSNEANLNISIRPIVSGDEQVTLDISVEQSTFGDAFAPGAPSDKFTQNFESMIRVKNNDMVILGGLESAQKSKNTRGLPGLARVPVLKWIFSSKTNTDADSKLSIMIKPTVIY